MTTNPSNQQPPVPSTTRRIVSAQLGPILATVIAVVGHTLFSRGELPCE